MLKQYTKNQIPDIIENILNDLNDNTEELVTDDQIKTYIIMWVNKNL
mgnify:CR=1 FL=1|tara:strand:+ start:65 stop:205 length:141 start_codon:yes stop_codon:yes gene_type:complete